MNDTAELTLIEADDLEPRQTTAITAPANVSADPVAMMMTAMERGASLEQIEKMMDLRERWERREAEKAFREAFAAFRGLNIIIPKTKHVDRGRGGSFDQAEYDEVCRRLSPGLSANGFSFRHDQKFGLRRVMTDGAENDIGWVWVTCYLEHRDGHSEKLELEGPPGDLSVNTPTQNMQTTASYLKRQSVLAITGTATGGEDDEAAMRKRTEKDADPEADSELTAKLQAGRDASMLGEKALTEWWGKLTAKERSALNDDFGGLRRAARAADAKGVQQ